MFKSNHFLSSITLASAAGPASLGPDDPDPAVAAAAGGVGSDAGASAHGRDFAVFD